MLMKILGLIDLAMALSLTLLGLGIPIWKLYIVAMVAHAIKALIFLKDILSLLDLAIVLYTLIMPFWSSPTLTLIVVIFLVLKGLYSFA